MLTNLHQEIIFSKKLAKYISSYNILHIDYKEDYTFIPQGVFEIIFQLDGQFEHKPLLKNEWVPWPNCFIGGLHNKAYKIRTKKGKGLFLTVRFKPNAAKYFFKNNLNEFKNTIVNLSDLWSLGGKTLENKFLEKETIDDKIELIEQFLISKFAPQKESFIDLAFSNIKNQNGVINIHNLAIKTGYSSSHFRKCFNENIGMSPSEFAKITRINSVLNIYKTQPDISLTKLTYLMGYFDQSHFIKDFKSIAHKSPKHLVSIHSFL